MRQKTYLKHLREELQEIEEQELAEILADYQEHFEVGKQKGRSEEDIAKGLGNPKKLAKHIKAESKIRKAEKTKKPSDLTRAVLATVGLGLLNIIFVLGPIAGLAGILIGIYGAGLGLFGGGILAIILASMGTTIVDTVIVTLPVSGIVLASIGLMALGIGIILLAWLLTVLFVKALLWYLRLNVRIIRGDIHA